MTEFCSPATNFNKEALLCTGEQKSGFPRLEKVPGRLLKTAKTLGVIIPSF